MQYGCANGRLLRWVHELLFWIGFDPRQQKTLVSEMQSEHPSSLSLNWTNILLGLHPQQQKRTVGPPLAMVILAQVPSESRQQSHQIAVTGPVRKPSAALWAVPSGCRGQPRSSPVRKPSAALSAVPSGCHGQLSSSPVRKLSVLLSAFRSGCRGRRRACSLLSERQAVPDSPPPCLIPHPLRSSICLVQNFATRTTTGCMSILKGNSWSLSMQN